MSAPAAVAAAPRTDATAEYDAIIIGAGVSGIYQLYRLRELGLDVRVLEAGADLGGTWYWNRYPGARFDSESYTYGYSFSEELLEEWDWKEHFAGQPENLRYLNYVVDKFDLRGHIQFSSTCRSAAFDDEAALWTVTLEDGASSRAASWSPRSGCCRRRPCRASRAWRASRASRSTPTTGRRSRSSSPASGWR